MRYSDDKNAFSKNLLGELSPFHGDYVFFVSDILDSLNQNIKVNIIPYSPFDTGFTDTLEDLILDADVLEMFFQKHENLKIVLSKNEIKQVAPAKYYVNCEHTNQSLKIRFIR